MYNTLGVFFERKWEKRIVSLKTADGRTVKRHGKLRYPAKFPCSLFEFCREKGLQLSSVIHQQEG